MKSAKRSHKSFDPAQDVEGIHKRWLTIESEDSHWYLPLTQKRKRDMLSVS